MMRPPLPLLLTLLSAAPLAAQDTPALAVIKSGSEAEFRGLHVAGDVIWASGSGGRYAVSTDGGASWRADSIPGAGGMFLVDVHGFGTAGSDARRAVVVATRFEGGEARIYVTDDGGASWRQVWRLAHPDVFLDGLAFFDDRRGFAFSDPVDGAFLVLRTEDGGETWTRVDALPPPLEGEAAFAASGTNAVALASGHGWFATGGGAAARVFGTGDFGITWSVAETPLPGGASAGLFGIAFADSLHGIAVGGDYREPQRAGPNLLRTTDGGVTWALAGSTEPPGVKYGVAWRGEWMVAPAPAGTSYSIDGGRTWRPLTSTSYNTAAFAADVTLWLAGVNGGLAKVTLPPAERDADRR
ncbi:MAG TPA: hypothetical protein VK939_10580 [Longimicrobiales bacterium]|nr:hypothetical protein [Longimicrobiales bacterium]